MTGSSTPARGGLSGGAARGAAWNALTFGVSKGLLLMTTIVLARVLEPADFGLLALALVVVLYLDVLGDLGVGPAVIYRRETSEAGAGRTAATAVVLAGSTGVLLTVLAVLCAPLVARVFDEPRLTGVVQVIAVSFLLRMLGVVHKSKLAKELQFARSAVPEITGALVKGGVSVGLAVAGAGVYSLAWGQVAGAAVTTCLYWAVSLWRFRPIFDRDVARDLLRFGVPVTLLGGLTAVTATLDQLIIGRQLDAESLGQYAIAYRLPELFVLHFCLLVSGALFPSYAKASDDPERLRRGYRSALRLVSIVTMPVGVGLALTAPDLIPVAFGPQWEPAVPVMQLLALGATLRSLTFNVGDVYKAIGRVGVLNRLAVLYLGLAAPTLWLLASRGIVAVAAGLLALSAVFTVIRFAVASRMMRVPGRAILAELLPAVAATAVMALAVAGVSALLQDLTSGARLPLLVVAGAITYAAAVAAVSRSTVRQLSGLARSAWGSTSDEVGKPDAVPSP
jgi:PST family polysaccharide transporter